MNADFGLSDNLIAKLVIPLVLGLVSWFIKDHLVGLASKRENLARVEWERQLTEIWSPLFYWSGVVMFSNAKEGWEGYGRKEVGAILSRSAHLLPLEHYVTLIRVLEQLTKQNTKEPGKEELKKVRAYIYDQIEILNYQLFRKDGAFDPVANSDVFGSVRALFRLLSIAIRHLVIWVTVISVVFLLYVCYLEQLYWILFLFVVVLFVVSYFDVKRERKLYREMKEKLNR